MLSKKSGRPRTPSSVDIMFQRYQEIMALAGHERSISQPFRLWHFGQITETELRACDLIGRIYEQYRRLQGFKPDPKSPSLAFASPGDWDGEPAIDSPRRAEWEQWVETTRQNWNSLAEILPASRDHRGIIERLCVQNEVVTFGELNAIHRALNVVAFEYDLGPVPPEISRLAPVRKSKPRNVEKGPGRAERFEQGAFAQRGPDSDAKPSAYHEPGSQGERDHKALVAKLKARQQECSA